MVPIWIQVALHQAPNPSRRPHIREELRAQVNRELELRLQQAPARGVEKRWMGTGEGAGDEGRKPMRSRSPAHALCIQSREARTAVGVAALGRGGKFGPGFGLGW